MEWGLYSGPSHKLKLHCNKILLVFQRPGLGSQSDFSFSHCSKGERGPSIVVCGQAYGHGSANTGINFSFVLSSGNLCDLGRLFQKERLGIGQTVSMRHILQANQRQGGSFQTRRRAKERPAPPKTSVDARGSCVRPFLDFPDDKITGDTYSNNKFFKIYMFVCFFKKSKKSARICR